MSLKNSKAWLYFHTLKHMKWSQVYYRVTKMAGFECGLGCTANADTESVHAIKPVIELDFDPHFLSRFQISELMKDHLSFLHSGAVMDWNGAWEFKDKSPLWNFNLHYFEYLFPLLSEYRKVKDPSYLEKAVFMIKSWIVNNPQEKKGPGWAPYTIDLRLTNWLSFYSLAENDLTEECRTLMRKSIAEQYIFLSRHVEKDILGNHYLEDLKALILCAIFFEDRSMLETAYSALLKECKEEILEDGVHFELSPMYHNIILEDLLKIYVALEEYHYPAAGLKEHIQLMLDAAWSMGESLNRLPLFNDCGNNVAKSLSSIVEAAANHLGISPVYKNSFPVAGFYIFKRGKWKLIVDAGQPGPTYIPGHAHCDALSFELFHCGTPVIVNCGTYAYQSIRRDEFRQTKAHNTVMVNGYEQSELWGTFRVARRSKVNVVDVGSDYLVMEMKDYKGAIIRRTITIGDKLIISDECRNAYLSAYLHLSKLLPVKLICSYSHKYRQSYAPEYGESELIDAISYEGRNHISVEISLKYE